MSDVGDMNYPNIDPGLGRTGMDSQSLFHRLTMEQQMRRQQELYTNARINDPLMQLAATTLNIDPNQMGNFAQLASPFIDAFSTMSGRGNPVDVAAGALTAVSRLGVNTNNSMTGYGGADNMSVIAAQQLGNTITKSFSRADDPIFAHTDNGKRVSYSDMGQALALSGAVGGVRMKTTVDDEGNTTSTIDERDVEKMRKTMNHALEGYLVAKDFLGSRDYIEFASQVKAATGLDTSSSAETSKRAIDSVMSSINVARANGVDPMTAMRVRAASVGEFGRAGSTYDSTMGEVVTNNALRMSGELNSLNATSGYDEVNMEDRIVAQKAAIKDAENSDAGIAITAAVAHASRYGTMGEISEDVEAAKRGDKAAIKRLDAYTKRKTGVSSREFVGNNREAFISNLTTEEQAMVAQHTADLASEQASANLVEDSLLNRGDYRYDLQALSIHKGGGTSDADLRPLAEGIKTLVTDFSSSTISDFKDILSKGGSTKEQQRAILARIKESKVYKTEKEEIEAARKIQNLGVRGIDLGTQVKVGKQNLGQDKESRMHATLREEAMAETLKEEEQNLIDAQTGETADKEAFLEKIKTIEGDPNDPDNWRNPNGTIGRMVSPKNYTEEEMASAKKALKGFDIRSIMQDDPPQEPDYTKRGSGRLLKTEATNDTEKANTSLIGEIRIVNGNEFFLNIKKPSEETN